MFWKYDELLTVELVEYRMRQRKAQDSTTSIILDLSTCITLHMKLVRIKELTHETSLRLIKGRRFDIPIHAGYL